MTRLSWPLHDCITPARGRPGLVEYFTDMWMFWMVLDLLTIWKLTCWPILPALCGRWRSQLFPCLGFSSSRWWCQVPQTKQKFMVNHDNSDGDYDDDEDDIWLWFLLKMMMPSYYSDLVRVWKWYCLCCYIYVACRLYDCSWNFRFDL